MLEKKQRYYILGSEWLYYKLYAGSQTSEQFIISYLKPICDQLIKNKVIDKWFFINYNDPDRHIRIRFHLINETKNLNNVIQNIHNIVTPFVESKLIKNVQTDTYKRELERYGTNTIDEFETLFFFNSDLVVKILEHVDGDPNKRWLYALKGIDSFLNNWEISLEDKGELFSFLEASYTREMGGSSSVKKQLAKKFRNNRSSIINIINNNEDIYLENILLEHNHNTKLIIESILNKVNQDKEKIFDLLESYIHMHCNRIFSSRQRLNEWVLYWFLNLHYKSEIARNRKKVN
ncbi:thiopeptide-type bacteriocin biosynthesis protein [Tenacibaculum sp. XPcli2-G]|uniref:thiopeptide-type bacteriocin biosynthesis protein n=1 Tax=Tenacibaculum sp. XPcli2-G TaxID=2954503 RepID=UPI00209746A6|nr:thiopeptide-type bacteriocin biosynthesis protein [Tenacibaculum sp. XPcli2-G]MCO7184269.1 thiopeptide-type bacteriocin biosynthesis protein [Tenacibaculum sp. XPcli2-G]